MIKEILSDKNNLWLYISGLIISPEGTNSKQKIVSLVSLKAYKKIFRRSNRIYIIKIIKVIIRSLEINDL